LSLDLYSEPNVDNKIETLSPFTVTFDGRVGGKLDRLVYVRNDNILRYYTNIAVTPCTLTGDSLVDDSTPGYYWRLMVKDIRPTNEEWNLLTS